jgi:hypothetical protein
MNHARCTNDGVIYSALEFSRQSSSDLESKRRFLQCPACGGPAFFRHASPIGRAACFGARPHAQCCELAAQDDAGDEELNHIPNSRIIVDFQYGALVQQAQFYSLGHGPIQKYAGYNNDPPHVHIYHRRLGSLLRNLIESPEFWISSQSVTIEGRGEFTAKDLFIPFQHARSEYSGHYRGYFGVISDAKLALDKSLWFNSGGNDNISFCLDFQFVDTIIQRYGINNLEDIAGAYILVFGTPRVSQNGKLFCVIEDISLMALKLT